MPAIRSNVIVGGDDFRANRADHLRLIAEFRGYEQKVRKASARANAKFRERGQLPPRERVNLILDRDSPFLELSSLAGLGMHEDDGLDNVFGGGSIAGMGVVSGTRCMVLASDSGIKGGAAHPMGVEKAIRAQEIALAAAVGRPDPYSGETPMLFVSPSIGASIDLDALSRFVEDRIVEAPAKPRAIHVIAEMPLTPVGKIFKPRLREIAAEQAARELIAAALPEVPVDILSETDAERGLIVKAKAPAEHCKSIQAELGRLPLVSEVMTR